MSQSSNKSGSGIPTATVFDRDADPKKLLLVIEEQQSLIRHLQVQLVQAEKMAGLGGLVAGVTHEINTPVGIGVTASSHLEEKVREMIREYKQGGLTQARFEEFLQNTEEISKILLTNLFKATKLIQSFKKVAVDQSSEDRRLFAIKEYLDEILLSLTPKLKRGNLDVIIDCSEELKLDSFPGRFSQIITNLVMNSITHGFDGKKGGIIRLLFQLADGTLHFTYSDNGKGIEKEDLERIFDPFFTTKRGSGGTGLGLHIVATLVRDALGGSITCLSEVGEGVTFVMVFPCSSPA